MLYDVVIEIRPGNSPSGAVIYLIRFGSIRRIEHGKGWSKEVDPSLLIIRYHLASSKTS